MYINQKDSILLFGVISLRVNEQFIRDTCIMCLLTSMVASVCMYSMLECDRPSSLLPLCAELTIPDVIVFRKEKGLPMATTNSPCRTSADRPSGSVGKGFCTTSEKKQIERGVQQYVNKHSFLYCAKSILNKTSFN